MNITKHDIYLIDESSNQEITIDSSHPITIIDRTRSSSELKRSIHVTKGSDVKIFGFLAESQNYSLHVTTQDEQSVSKIGYAIVGKKDEKIDVSIISQLASSLTTTDMHVVSLVADEAHITLDGVVQIDEGISGVSGHILEENIFLGSSGKIKGIPSLLVRSNDVQAGHAARMERIPDDKLYYLRSRGIPKDDATVMMIRSIISQAYGELDKERRDELIEEVMQACLTQ